MATGRGSREPGVLSPSCWASPPPRAMLREELARAARQDARAADRDDGRLWRVGLEPRRRRGPRSTPHVGPSGVAPRRRASSTAVRLRVRSPAVQPRASSSAPSGSVAGLEADRPGEGHRGLGGRGRHTSARSGRRPSTSGTPGSPTGRTELPRWVKPWDARSSQSPRCSRSSAPQLGPMTRCRSATDSARCGAPRRLGRGGTSLAATMRSRAIDDLARGGSSTTTVVSLRRPGSPTASVIDGPSGGWSRPGAEARSDDDARADPDGVERGGHDRHTMAA